MVCLRLLAIWFITLIASGCVNGKYYLARISKMEMLSNVYVK